MWKRFEKPYIVEPYHDSSFTCDDVGQQVMRAAALRKDHRTFTSFVVMMCAFAAMVLLGAIPCPLGLGIAALVFVGALLFCMLLLLTGRPRLACSRCWRCMKTDWGPISDDRNGEYQICPSCRTYVFSYRSSR
jgi:hypothetical protein